MSTTGKNVGLAEWIIDDTCLVFCSLPKAIFNTSSFFQTCNNFHLDIELAALCDFGNKTTLN